MPSPLFLLTLLSNDLHVTEPSKTIKDVFFFGKTLIPKYYVFNEVNRLSFYTKINKAEKNVMSDFPHQIVSQLLYTYIVKEVCE